MKNTKLILATLLICSMVFTSCKKDDDGNDTPEPVQKTNSELLVLGSWMQVSGTYDPPVFGVSDYFSEYDDCDKDDLYTFKNDGTFVIDEGNTKCSSGDPQIISTGTWVMSSDEKTFVIDDDGSTTEYKIEFISATDMTLTITENQQTDRMKFKHP